MKKSNRKETVRQSCMLDLLGLILFAHGHLSRRICMPALITRTLEVYRTSR